MGGFGFSFRMPIASGLAMMVTTYILTLAMTFGMGWLASALAPTFGGQSNLVQGLKLAVFGGTPMMLAGVLNAVPALSIIGLLVALYSLYVMYLGLPVLMKNPTEKTVVYMVVLIIASIIAGVVLSMVSRAFTPSMGGMGMGGMGMRGGDATITTPEGEVKIDAQKMEAFAKQMEAMAKKLEQDKK